MNNTVRYMLLLLSVATARARHLEVKQPPPTTILATATSILQARQINPTTQASINNALCFPSPAPTNGIASEQASDRGVPFFLNDVLTSDFLPNNKNSMNGWFEYFWTEFDDASNPADPASSCTSFVGTCVPYAKCNDVMELFWNQNTIVNFRDYLADFDYAFQQAVGNVTLELTKLNNDFPIQNPIFSEAALFNNIGAGLSIVGAGASIVPGAAVGSSVISVIGGVFSAVGANVQQTATEDNLISLSERLGNVSTQVSTNNAKFIDDIINSGDLSAYPSRIYANSTYTNPIVAFFDNGNFLYPVFTNQEQRTSFAALIGHQILTILVGTAITEANYFITMGVHDVQHCPVGTGLTGVVIDKVCFTLEAPGSGEVGNLLSETKQMDSTTVGTIENYYQISLSDIYSSSWNCQSSTNVYSSSVDFNSLDLTNSSIPYCFYSLPVLKDSPCNIYAANITSKTPQIGLTYLPDNLASIFTKTFCQGYPDPNHHTK